MAVIGRVVIDEWLVDVLELELNSEAIESGSVDGFRKFESTGEVDVLIKLDYSEVNGSVYHDFYKKVIRGQEVRITIEGTTLVGVLRSLWVLKKGNEMHINFKGVRSDSRV